MHATGFCVCIFEDSDFGSKSQNSNTYCNIGLYAGELLRAELFTLILRAPILQLTAAVLQFLHHKAWGLLGIE